MLNPMWRVLLIGDSGTMARIVETILRQCGFKDIHVAHDGKTALQRMREWSFDLILSDWEMSPVDGVAVLSEVRQDKQLKDTPFILMSANKDPRWVVLAKEAGADRCLQSRSTLRHCKVKFCN